ncbi:MAG: DeoR/GlpR family DNA-binding transcription regulator, partial [Oscillospiraceae bacterium]
DETIRRDLKLLEQQGLLVKTHGGAFIQDGATNDINISIRDGAFLDSKAKIAQEATRLIHNGDSIFLDCSTTSFHIGNAVRNKRITVITNSLKISSVLASYDNIRLIVMGGVLNRTHMCYVGQGTLQNLSNYFVDKAFISCRSLSIQHGITDSNENMAEVRSLILNHASSVYLVADYTKFGKTSFVSIGSFQKLTGLITDKPLSEEWIDCLNANNVLYYFPNE